MVQMEVWTEVLDCWSFIFRNFPKNDYTINLVFFIGTHKQTMCDGKKIWEYVRLWIRSGMKLRQRTEQGIYKKKQKVRKRK